MYYILIGVIIVMSVGTATSFIFGASDIDDIDTDLLVPPIGKWVQKRQKSKSWPTRNDAKLEEISTQIEKF